MKRTSNYGFLEKIYMAMCIIICKFLFPGVRLIRFPFVVRGKKYIDFGKNLTTGRNCRFDVNGLHDKKILHFGDNVNIGDNVRISCANSVTIGSNVLMGSRVLIIDNSHGRYSGEKQDLPNTPPNERQLISKPIVIEDNVWLGEGCVIQQGVTVGYGSIVAANSVVTKDIPEKTIVGGVPARVLKKYRLNEKKWG